MTLGMEADLSDSGPKGFTKSTSVCGVEAIMSVFSKRPRAWLSNPVAGEAMTYGIV
jgi:hypothetical protein